MLRHNEAKINISEVTKMEQKQKQNLKTETAIIKPFNMERVVKNSYKRIESVNSPLLTYNIKNIGQYEGIKNNMFKCIIEKETIINNNGLEDIDQKINKIENPILNFLVKSSFNNKLRQIAKIQHEENFN